MTQSGHQGHKTRSCRAVCKANEMFLFFDLFLSSGGVLAPFDTQWSLLKLGVVPFTWGTLTVIKSCLSRNHPHLANGIKTPKEMSDDNAK